MAQSPLSQRILALERELGVALLERTNRRVALTDAGSAFLAEARATLRAAQAARHVADRFRAGEIGSLRLGYVASAAFEALPTLLAALHAAAPDLTVDLHRLDSAAQLDALAAREIDAGIARAHPPDGIAVTAVELPADPLHAVLPNGYPRTGERSVVLADLADDPWVLATDTPRSHLNATVLHACARAGFTPRITQRAPDQPSILGLVAAGLGVDLVPRSIARLSVPGTSSIALTSTYELALPTVLLHRQEAPGRVVANLIAVASDLRRSRPTALTQ